VTPAPYRTRLRLEGLTLAGCGFTAAVALLSAAGDATARPGSTVGQLVVVLVLTEVLGLRSVRSALAAARPVARAAAGSGEPTPLWQLPLIVAALTLSLGVLAGWDAGLRVAGGCVAIGLVQALVLERVVAAAEQRDARRYVRVAGSRIGRGSRLGYVA